MKCLIFANGGPSIGMGHIIRTLTLAKSLRENGFEIVFASTMPEGRKKVASEGFKAMDVSEVMLECDEKERTKLCIVDRYDISDEFFISLRKICSYIAYIDDLNLYNYPVDVIINGTALINHDDYNKQSYATQLLLGLSYNLVDKRFCAGNMRYYNNQAKNIMITMGGSDPSNTTSFILNKLIMTRYIDYFTFHVVLGKQFCCKKEILAEFKDCKQLQFYSDLDDLSSLMNRCDFAFSAGGITLYELIAAGVPAVSVITASNQENQVSALDIKGTMPTMGNFADITVGDMNRVMRGIHDDYKNWIFRAQTASSIIDGNGAKRIVNELMKGIIKMENKVIPYGRQWIDNDDIQAVVDTLKSDYLTQGPKIKEFENKVAAMAETKYAVAFCNGTAALHAACFAADIGYGDEVITSPLTFAASANCALYVGAKPVFADIDPVTYNISPQEIEKKITSKTKAIIPVHYSGQPCDMSAIMEIAEQHQLIVIEDAAHGVGAQYKGKSVGSMGHMAMFSFHPVKQITAGEGGVIVTNDDKLYQKLEMFRSHGITRNPELLTTDEGPWYYEQQFLGYNYRMTDIQAALGNSQMDKIETWRKRREEIVAMYQHAFNGIKALITPVINPEVRSGWHLYVLRFDEALIGKSRRQIFEMLRAKGIGVNVHYIPVYWHPYYQELGYAKGICPVAESVYQQIMSLPLFPKMTDAEVDYVINTVLSILEK